MELWHSSFDMKTSTSHSLCDEDENLSENEILNIDAAKNENYLIDGDSHCRRRIPQAFDYDDDCDSLSPAEHDSYSDDDDDDEKQIGAGLNELDSFLVAGTRYDAKTTVTDFVWQYAS